MGTVGFWNLDDVPGVQCLRRLPEGPRENARHSFERPAALIAGAAVTCSLEPFHSVNPDIPLVNLAELEGLPCDWQWQWQGRDAAGRVR